MAVNMHGQLAIQAATPSEDPIKVGSLWVDTSGTATLKVCTSVSPYTFAEVTGTDTGITQLTGDVTAGPGNGSQAATIAALAVTTGKIANDAVTYAKMQDVSATDKVLGRSTAGAGDVEEIACTAAGRALIDDASAAAQRTTLGVGTGDSPTFVAVTVSDGQIVFPATQVASAGANTLDDYEEDTWTPVIGGAGGQSGQTYTTQSGRYTKIGRVVVAQWTAVLSAKGTITGGVQVQGLPFTLGGGGTDFSFATISWSGLATSYVNVIGRGAGTTSVLNIFGATAATADAVGTQLVTGDLNNNANFSGFVVYQV